MIILPCPKRPDLDCIAGSLAYAAYLTDVKHTPARAWLCGEPDGEARFYLDLYPQLAFATDAEVARASGFVLVDLSAKTVLPPNVDPLKVMQIIDHRSFTQPAIDFPNAEINVALVGAAATQVAEYYMREDVAPAGPLAAMLYGAIFTHTLCLQSATTTDRDRVAAAWLERFVPDAGDLIDRQLRARTSDIVTQMPAILDIEMKMETSRLGDYGFTLLEMNDGENFWQEHRAVIKAWAEDKTHPVLFNIIDVKRNVTFLYSNRQDYTDLLEAALAAVASDGLFTLRPAWFRKQIIPLLK